MEPPNNELKATETFRACRKRDARLRRPKGPDAAEWKVICCRCGYLSVDKYLYIIAVPKPAVVAAQVMYTEIKRCLLQRSAAAVCAVCAVRAVCAVCGGSGISHFQL